jgi:hypothetical protein
VGLNGLLPGTVYYWHARAVNTDGTTYSNGSSSAFYSFTTTSSNIPPGAFGKSTPTNGKTGVLPDPTLYWGASTGATSYDYCYDTTNDNSCSNWVSNGSNTSRKLNGLALNTTYYWHVRAINSYGVTYSNGSSTAFWSLTTAQQVLKTHLPLILKNYTPPPVQPPGAFNKDYPANGATGVGASPMLYWMGSAGATYYEYCIDTSNDNACALWVNNGNTLSKELSGLSAGTTYYWHVRATNSGGVTYSNGSESAYWNFATIPVLPAPVLNPIKNPEGDGNYIVSWSDVNGTTDYEL